MSVKFQFSKLIMEKFLRRSFYDAVLRLYETAHGARIISVSLEGYLTLVVNKNENFVIKLNEIAQRADDVDDPNQQGPTKLMNFKTEEPPGSFILGKEGDGIASLSSGERSEVIVNLDDHIKDDRYHDAHVDTVELKYSNEDHKRNLSVQDQFVAKVEDRDVADSGRLDSEQRSSMAQAYISHSEDGNVVTKVELDGSGAEEICFLPAQVGQVEDVKRKYELVDYGGHNQLVEKKSLQKRRKLSPSPYAIEDIASLKPETKDKQELAMEGGDVNANSLQLLPHTATDPIVIEEEGSCGATVPVSDERNQTQENEHEQQQQFASILQLRDQVGTGVTSVSVFRQQDLEELARQQQQWQMIAYQRSLMEKSYLQQYQRDSERLRWELATVAAQQEQPGNVERVTLSLPAQAAPSRAREFASASASEGSEVAEKLYMQAQASTDLGLITAAALEQARKSAQDISQGVVKVEVSTGDKGTGQYIRILEEHPAPGPAIQGEAEYEAGELRHDNHVCALCGIKFMAADPLIRHMEKHRVAFERSCSVCQSGTLTGNMLKLHMEASHGPETSFTLPSMAVAVPPIITSSSSPPTSTTVEYSQPFQTVLQGGYLTSVQLEQAGIKIATQPQVIEQGNASVSKEMDEEMKSNELQKYEVEGESQSLPRPDGECIAADEGGSQQEQGSYLGLASAQFYPLIACQVCGEKFALSEALDEHVENQHKDTGGCTYTCKPCCLSFESHVEYSKHVSRHETVVVSGVTVSDSGSPSLATTSCTTSAAAAAVAAAAAAVAASSAAQLKCSHCLKTFKSVKQLRLHYVAAHACCHFCEYCRAGFPDAMSLELHEQLHTLEPEKLSFRCDICSKAFYTQSQCSAHKRTHKDEKAHACQQCGSSFFKRGDLTKHVRTVHSPSRLFSCKFCGKKGTRMDNMRSHVRSHHKNMTRDQIINMIEVIE